MLFEARYAPNDNMLYGIFETISQPEKMKSSISRDTQRFYYLTDSREEILELTKLFLGVNADITISH